MGKRKVRHWCIYARVPLWGIFGLLRGKVLVDMIPLERVDMLGIGGYLVKEDRGKELMRCLYVTLVNRILYLDKINKPLQVRITGRRQSLMMLIKPGQKLVSVWNKISTSSMRIKD